MNKVSKFAVVVSLATLLGSPGLFAGYAESEEAYVKSYEGRADIPVPVSVVSPHHVGRVGQVDIRFVVSETGQPTELTVRSSTNDALIASAMEAVAQWKFAPATLNGVPVARAVIVPIRFKGSAGLFASH